MHHLWDKIFKVIGDRYPKEVINFALGDEKVKIEGKFEQERIAIEYQTADINFWIRDGGVKKLLNLEPYSAWDEELPAKVFSRNGIITKSLDHKNEVISIAIVLTKGSFQGVHKAQLTGGKITNEFHFPVVSFEKVEDIIEKYPPLAPFVLKIDRSYQEKVIKKVSSDKILLCITALILAKLGVTKEEALKMVDLGTTEFREALAEVPLMKDVFEDAEHKKAKEIALNMLKDGFELSRVVKLTGLSDKEIALLQKQI